MNCIEKLKMAREAELCVRAELDHIERLHRIMRLPQKNKSYAGNIAEKLSRLEAELNDEIDRAVDIKREALGILSALEGAERTVLYRYYILGEDWKTVAEKMFFCERRVFEYRKSGLAKLELKYRRIFK